MKFQELEIGDTVLFQPIYDLNRAKVKVIAANFGEILIEFLEPFENTYLNFNKGDRHTVSEGHLQPVN